MKYYAVVGDNGYLYTSCGSMVYESLGKLRNLTVTEFADEIMAHQYAIYAYTTRFMMRNYYKGISPKIPVNLQRDVFFIDQDFEKREGEKQLPIFPGIPY